MLENQKTSHRTPLLDAHQKLGATLASFEDWEMPLLYTNAREEHIAARNTAGLFDISHLGEITLSGAAAREFLDSVLTNAIREIEPGEGQYTLMCNERGGTLDELVTYRLSGEVYMLVVNASRTALDVAWLQDQASRFARRDELQLTDATHNYAAVAALGPRVREFIDECIPGKSLSGTRVPRVTSLKKNQIGGFPFGGGSVIISRRGYASEDGFEILGRDGPIQQMWEALLESGRAFGVRPCGFAARDTLRIEAGSPRYGCELDESITPIEAGLDAYVAFDKGEFMGRASLAEQMSGSLRKKCIAFTMPSGSSPPQRHDPIWVNGVQAGTVTSGTRSPSLAIPIGLGFLPPHFATPGTEIEIETGGIRSPGLVVEKLLGTHP